VASKLGYTYIDTGAMYRAVTLYFLQHYVSLTNPHDIEDALKKITVSFRKNPENGKDDVFLNGLNVEREARSMFVSEMVSQVSALHEVRVAMVAQQQKMGKKKGVVMDGRDIGTFVFPDAELKIFMMADMSLRAYRRQLELLEVNQMVPLHEIEENIRKRDMLDTSRKENPLIQAVDALVLDTTFLTIDEQVDYVVRLATSKIASPSL
jgi:cytidylate kinase